MRNSSLYTSIVGSSDLLCSPMQRPHSGSQSAVIKVWKCFDNDVGSGFEFLTFRMTLLLNLVFLAGPHIRSKF